MCTSYICLLTSDFYSEFVSSKGAEGQIFEQRMWRSLSSLRRGFSARIVFTMNIGRMHQKYVLYEANEMMENRSHP